MAVFVNSSILCLKDSEYASASLKNTNNLSGEKESDSHKNYYENVCDEGCF